MAFPPFSGDWLVYGDCTWVDICGVVAAFVFHDARVVALGDLLYYGTCFNIGLRICKHMIAYM